MLRSRLLVSTLALCVAGATSLASEVGRAPSEQAADFVPPPLPTQPALAEDLAPPGLAMELTQRLANPDRRLAAADKADRAALLQFYGERRFEPVWLDDSGLTPAAQSVLAEIAHADDWGLDSSDFQLPLLASLSELTRAARADADIEISLAVLKYARYARGGRADPQRLSKNLDRRLRLLDPRQVIANAAAEQDPAAYLRALHPQHPQFEKLRQHYLALKRGDVAGRIEPVSISNGKSGGKRGGQPSQADTMRAVLANMEQWRWMPDDLGHFHVWVNIPEFTLRVVADGEVVHSERVIVGKAATQTPVFSDEIQHVIFHPFWGVPDSIKKNEILPSLARGNIDVLARNNLRIQYRGRNIDPRSVDWSTADMRKFHVFQPPGADNVLGVVKFRFPNSHAVYIHDTPSKRLFNETVRTFSHGCMRVRDPVKLASLLLTQDEKWTADRVNAAVRKGPKNNWVALPQKVPVHITYFTAWVDDDGTLKHFGDVYGHEARVARAVAAPATLVAAGPQVVPAVERAAVAPAKARPRPQAAPPAQVARRADRDWMARVFNP